MTKQADFFDQNLTFPPLRCTLIALSRSFSEQINASPTVCRQEKEQEAETRLTLSGILCLLSDDATQPAIQTGCAGFFVPFPNMGIRDWGSAMSD